MRRTNRNPFTVQHRALSHEEQCTALAVHCDPAAVLTAVVPHRCVSSVVVAYVGGTYLSSKDAARWLRRLTSGRPIHGTGSNERSDLHGDQGCDRTAAAASASSVFEGMLSFARFGAFFSTESLHLPLFGGASVHDESVLFALFQGLYRARCLAAIIVECARAHGTPAHCEFSDVPHALLSDSAFHVAVVTAAAAHRPPIKGHNVAGEAAEPNPGVGTVMEFAPRGSFEDPIPALKAVPSLLVLPRVQALAFGEQCHPSVLGDIGAPRLPALRSLSLGAGKNSDLVTVWRCVLAPTRADIDAAFSPGSGTPHLHIDGEEEEEGGGSAMEPKVTQDELSRAITGAFAPPLVRRVLRSLPTPVPFLTTVTLSACGLFEVNVVSTVIACLPPSVLSLSLGGLFCTPIELASITAGFVESAFRGTLRELSLRGSRLPLQELSPAVVEDLICPPRLERLTMHGAMAAVVVAVLARTSRLRLGTMLPFRLTTLDIDGIEAADFAMAPVGERAKLRVAAHGREHISLAEHEALGDDVDPSGGVLRVVGLLGKCHCLSALTLRLPLAAPRVPVADLVACMLSLPPLSTLDLHGVFSIHAASAVSVASAIATAHGRTLAHLHLSTAEIGVFPLGFFTTLLNDCPLLKSLDFSGPAESPRASERSVTSEEAAKAFTDAVSHAPPLRALDVSGTQLNTAVVFAFACVCRDLEALAAADAVVDAMVLAEGLFLWRRSLRTLRLGGFKVPPAVRGATVDEPVRRRLLRLVISRCLSQLTTLDVSGTRDTLLLYPQDFLELLRGPAEDSGPALPRSVAAALRRVASLKGRCSDGDEASGSDDGGDIITRYDRGGPEQSETSLPQLTELDIGGCGACDVSLAALPAVPGLRRLGLAGSEITDATLEIIGGTVASKAAATVHSHRDVPALGHLPSNGPHCRGAEMEDFFGGVSDSDSTDDDDAFSMGEEEEEPEYVSSGPGAEGRRVVPLFPQLRAVDLTGCRDVTEDGVAALRDGAAPSSEIAAPKRGMCVALLTSFV